MSDTEVSDTGVSDTEVSDTEVSDEEVNNSEVLLTLIFFNIVEHQISFSSYQLFVFVANYVAYSLLLYNRKSFTFVLPSIMMDHYYSSYEVGTFRSFY